VVAQVATLIRCFYRGNDSSLFIFNQWWCWWDYAGNVALAVQEAVLHLFKRQVFMEEQMAAQVRYN
jgi:hypothetical protein